MICGDFDEGVSKLTNAIAEFHVTHQHLAPDTQFDNNALARWREYYETHEALRDIVLYPDVDMGDILLGNAFGDTWFTGSTGQERFDFQGWSVDAHMLRALWMHTDMVMYRKLHPRSLAEVRAALSSVYRSPWHSQGFLSDSYNYNLTLGIPIRILPPTNCNCPRQGCNKPLWSEVERPNCVRLCACECAALCYVEIEYRTVSPYVTEVFGQMCI